MGTMRNNKNEHIVCVHLAFNRKVKYVVFEYLKFFLILTREKYAFKLNLYTFKLLEMCTPSSI